MRSKLLLFLKGMAMGAADVVPGVSGGTIAFITGIYEDFLGALASLTGDAPKQFFRGDLRGFWKTVNGPFLAVLFAGIFTSILSLAHLIEYLMTHHAVLLWSFFFGLVVGSVYLMLRTLKTWDIAVIIALLLGTGIAYYITIMPAATGSDSLGYLVLCGAIAICAMVLPGISGSFILLLLGAYPTVIKAIADRNLAEIAAVGTGAIIGLLSFSKLLKWMFDRYTTVVTALLTGFLVGSLNKLWPWKEVLESYTKHEGTAKEEVVAIVEQNIAPGPDWSGALLFALMGCAVVVVLDALGRKFKR